MTTDETSDPPPYPIDPPRKRSTTRTVGFALLLIGMPSAGAYFTLAPLVLNKPARPQAEELPPAASCPVDASVSEVMSGADLPAPSQTARPAAAGEGARPPSASRRAEAARPPLRPSATDTRTFTAPPPRTPARPRPARPSTETAGAQRLQAERLAAAPSALETALNGAEAESTAAEAGAPNTVSVKAAVPEPVTAGIDVSEPPVQLPDIEPHSAAVKELTSETARPAASIMEADVERDPEAPRQEAARRSPLSDPPMMNSQEGRHARRAASAGQETLRAPDSRQAPGGRRLAALGERPVTTDRAVAQQAPAGLVEGTTRRLQGDAAPAQTVSRRQRAVSTPSGSGEGTVAARSSESAGGADLPIPAPDWEAPLSAAGDAALQSLASTAPAARTAAARLPDIVSAARPSATMPPPPPAPPPPPPRPAFDPAGPYLVQVASLANRDATCDVWADHERRWPDLFDDAEKSVLRAELADGRVVYRMRAGAFAARDDAARFCEMFAARGGQCFVTMR